MGEDRGTADVPLASELRSVAMILAEQDDEWQDGRRYFIPRPSP